MPKKQMDKIRKYIGTIIGGLIFATVLSIIDLETVNMYLTPLMFLATLFLLSKILHLQNVTNELFELTKNIRTTKMINERIDKQIELLRSFNGLYHTPLHDLLEKGVKKSKYVYIRLLDKDFNFKDYNRIKNDIIDEFKTLKASVDTKEFEYFLNEKTNDFIIDIENTIIMPLLNNYLIELHTITEKLTNGERRKQFENICVKLTTDIYQQTVNLFKSYYNK